MSTLTIRVLSIVQRLIDWSSLTHSHDDRRRPSITYCTSPRQRTSLNPLVLYVHMYTAHLDIDVRTSTMMYSCIDVVVGGAFIILLLKKE